MSAKRIEETRRIRRIADAVRKVELVETAAWNDLDVLSSNTLVEAVEVFEDEIRTEEDSFEGPINVHVTLQYPEDITMSETFPGRFQGRWEGKDPVIELVSIDTSSFYS